MPGKVILDVDTGIDDALALLLAAASPEIELIGVTCVAGNVTLDHVTRNTLAVLDLAGHAAPVAVGARKPLMATLQTATLFHGDNGIAGLDLPAPTHAPVDEDAASFLVRTAREQPGEVTLVAVGPLTNVALAVQQDPAFARNLKQLIVMGGAVGHVGNTSPTAEANFRNDPEAAFAVVHAGASLLLVDLAATHSTVLPMSRLPDDMTGRTQAAQFAGRLLDFYGGAYVAHGMAGPVLHDPLAAALAAVPDLATPIPLALDVETAGFLSRGASTGNFTGTTSLVEDVGDHLDVRGLVPVPFNATIAREIQVDVFLTLFLERVGLAP